MMAAPEESQRRYFGDDSAGFFWKRRSMFPIRDNIPSRTTPVVNYAVIVICTLVFLAQVTESPDAPSLVERYGLIPVRVLHPDAPVEITVAVREVQTPTGVRLETEKRPAAPSAVSPWLTFLTCIFLHGSLMHIVGNMWFLFIFGDNIEDRFGHVGYALFYLFCGGAASLVHYLSEMSSELPTIGASGAIAGIMGAYFVWYPRAQVQTLLPIFFLIQIVVLPASLFLGLWFVFQFFEGVGFAGGTESTGVAWWAHIGGFAIGAFAALLMGRTPLTRPPNVERRFVAPHPGVYRVNRDL
jgi:membrane associated rhomboid family serine protease